MPKSFCPDCGTMYDTDNKDIYESAKVNSRPKTRSTVRAVKAEMAEVDNSDYCLSLDKSMDKLTLFEKRELAAQEVQALELEEELADLEEKKRWLLERCDRRRRTIGDGIRNGMTAMMEDRVNTGGFDDRDERKFYSTVPSLDGYAKRMAHCLTEPSHLSLHPHTLAVNTRNIFIYVYLCVCIYTCIYIYISV